MVGHLVGVAATSLLVYVGLDHLAPVSDAVALWCSGLAAGLCSLPAWTVIRRRLASTLAPSPAPSTSRRGAK
ncbi:hypothetical protein [Sphaerisporangium dianthi]|uniref:hypothetical protein n=1 Tax=Sphaerisporangium dianthi TaxID=1436120 RepID=UPI0036D321B9